MSQKKTSPWMWVGCGCAVAILVTAIAVGGLGLFTAKKLKDFAEEMEDPEARERKVLSILGTDAPPDGMHTMLGMSIPFVMELAILSDLPPEEDGEPQGFGDAGLIYVHMKLPMATDQGELREFFDGTNDDTRVLRENGINLDVDQVLGRGSVPRDDLELLWASFLGDVDAVGNRTGDAVAAGLLFDCPGDDQARIAFWFEAETEQTAQGDYTGSPGDPEEIARFSEALRPCGS